MIKPLTASRILDRSPWQAAFETGFVALPANTLIVQNFGVPAEKQTLLEQNLGRRSLFRREDSCNFSCAVGPLGDQPRKVPTSALFI